MAPHTAYFRVKIRTHTRHISEFLEINKTAGAYSLQICYYLSQIQRETKAFLLIVRYNTERPPFSDCQWRHRTLFFFVGLKNRVNLVLFFKLWIECSHSISALHWGLFINNNKNNNKNNNINQITTFPAQNQMLFNATKASASQYPAHFYLYIAILDHCMK